MTTTDTMHHRYRGEDLERYRVALYAQWLASRDGVVISDERTHPDNISIEYDGQNRPRSVVFYSDTIDVRVHLPGSAPCPSARD
jgi:hypothetical protein